MKVLINDDESSALWGLSYMQIALYIRALRPHMDYSTGIIGIKRGISSQSIAEALYIEPKPGVKGGSPSKDQIKRGLNELIKVGLITRLSTHRKMIYCCNLATTDQTKQNKLIQNKAAPMSPSTAPTHTNSKTIIKSVNCNKFIEKDATNKGKKAATPPVSGNIYTLSQEPVVITYISDDFQPSEKIISIAKQHNCPTATCQDELTRFISFHQAKGNRRYNWDAEFLSWLLRAKQYKQEKQHVSQTNSAKRQPGNHKNLSAVDRVFNANQKLINETTPIRQIETIDHYD